VYLETSVSEEMCELASVSCAERSLRELVLAPSAQHACRGI
jgi:hypothetical protein